MLELICAGRDAQLLEAWRARIERATGMLGWPAPTVASREHGDGASLAFSAPLDQLFTATEINEWAVCASLYERDPARWDLLEAALVAAQPEANPPPVLDEPGALERFLRLASEEARPALRALVDEARARGLPCLLDVELVSVGEGCVGRTWPVAALPALGSIDWSALGSVPVALVTGSNGKTTTVRLIAACMREAGWTTGYSCTDGVFVDGRPIESGDYSGPVGARMVLRDPRVGAAVLETARGGILRRGLAVEQARVAVVTNISADHFGEYGIHDLESLADVKLVVGRALTERGLLVLNADDEVIRNRVPGGLRRGPGAPGLALFALDDDHELLRQHRASGGWSAGVRGGRLRLHVRGQDHELGLIDAMPLSAGGLARYNVANLAAAALAATGLGVASQTIAATFANFGRRGDDNPGRLMRFERGGVRILLDYAHNPAGLRGVLELARSLQGHGRLALLLGHAGNREDADLERIAEVVAGYRPDLVVVKEIDGYLRGRAEGEVARILRAALLRRGLPGSSLPLQLREVEAARHALAWARPGDVVLLLVHSLGARTQVLDLLGAPGRGSAGGAAQGA